MRIPPTLLCLCLGLLGCAADGEPVEECAGDRCEVAGSRAELLAAIEGFHDPVAELLRAGAADDGTLAGDYRAVLDGVGTQLGCDASTEQSFVVLSNDGYLPKPIVTRCAGDATTGSQFFMAMVGTDAGFEPHSTHLAAWDADAGVYRRYATAPGKDGGMAINVAPEFCLGCHAVAAGGMKPEKLGTWQPLMNEMTSPWANWNAEPGFSSVMFSEHFDPTFAADATYQDVTRAGTLASAADFEPIVRAGVHRVTSTRLKQRDEAAHVDRALELLRPLYCDETLNYVSEVHDSGELRMHALVDDSFRSLYRALDIDGDWSWLADNRLVLPAPAANQTPVTLIPVRGESTLQVELGLVSRGALEPLDALRVRALDWKHPVQSAFRCDLFRRARDRIAAGALDAAIAASGAATTEVLLPLVYAEIMTIPVGAGRMSLRTASLLQIADATDPATVTALASGALAGFETTPAELATAIETHVTSTTRATLALERNRRACLAVSGYATAPLYPDVECSAP